MEEHDHRFTVKKWLKTKMPLLSEDGIIAILAEFGKPPFMELSYLTAKEKDLLLAQGYFEQIMLCSSSAEIKDEDGNWSHSEGAKNVSDADKARWKAMCNRLRRKWGEEEYFIPSIKLRSSGLKTWRLL